MEFCKRVLIIGRIIEEEEKNNLHKKKMLKVNPEQDIHLC
jgi:hypothetical protein